MKTFYLLVCLISVGLLGCGASARPRDEAPDQGARTEDSAPDQVIGSQDQGAKPESRSQDQVARSEDKVLVAGDPPLTQFILDRFTAGRERQLKMSLTAVERKEYQQLLTKDWKAWDRARKILLLKVYDPLEARNDSADPRDVPPDRLKMLLEELSRRDAPASDQWLLRTYAARPKAPANPVRVSQPSVSPFGATTLADPLQALNKHLKEESREDAIRYDRERQERERQRQIQERVRQDQLRQQQIQDQLRQQQIQDQLRQQRR